MTAGLCPLCESPAPVGARCVHPVCARRGYHAVPRIHIDARPPTEAIDPFVGRRFGAFLIVAPLGAGGMGSVYLGVDEQVGQRVAIKMLAPAEADATEAARARLRKEATALARLSHPNIVRLVAFDTRTRPPFIAMEYADGRTLAHEMRAGLAAPDACRILVQLSQALDAAHGRAIVHRDIKPANVMLQATPDESHFVRLVDFGLVKFTGDGHQTRMVAGTPQYMAPEQVSQGAIGPWTDFYAMGVLTFELLTGQRLFGEGPGLDIMRLKRSPDLSPLGVLEPDAIAPPMQAFLRRALARDTTARIADGMQFREALEALLDADRAPAIEAPFVARSRRRSARWYRRWAWASAGLAAAAMAWAVTGAASEADADREPRPPEPEPIAAAPSAATPIAPTPPEPSPPPKPDATLMFPPVAVDGPDDIRADDLEGDARAAPGAPVDAMPASERTQPQARPTPPVRAPAERPKRRPATRPPEKPKAPTGDDAASETPIKDMTFDGYWP